MKRSVSSVPTFDSMLLPTIQALQSLGGSGTTEEIYEKVVQLLSVPDQVLEILHGSTSQSKVEYRLAWSRTYLNILNQVKGSQLWHPWLPYLFIFRPNQMLVGLGGFKSVPDSKRTVEIGYSVAPNYQSRGFATSAARQLIKIAFESQSVDCVCAHTLAESNASTRVLEKCGMTKVSQTVDPEVGNVWRWEIGAV